MTVALIVGFATITALIAAAVWVVTIVRADGRERAAALVLAERLQGELNVEKERATASITALAKDVRAATRRADALEEWARNRAGAVDDGTDLLLAELSVIAAGSYDDDDTITGPTRSGAGTGAGVPHEEAVARPAAASGGDIARDDTLPGGAAP